MAACPKFQVFFGPIRVFLHLLITNLSFMYIYKKKLLPNNKDVILAMIFNVLCGLAMTIFSARPLMIVGLSGPISVYDYLVYSSIKYNLHGNTAVHGFRLITSIMTFILLTIFSMLKLPKIAQYFTNFTEEILELEIAITLILIVNKAQEPFKLFLKESIDKIAAITLFLSIEALMLAFFLHQIIRNKLISKKVIFFLNPIEMFSNF